MGDDFNTQFDWQWVHRRMQALREEAEKTKNDVVQSGSVLGGFEDIEAAAISQAQREDKYGGLRANNDYNSVINMDFNSLYPRLIKGLDEDSIKHLITLK